MLPDVELVARNHRAVKMLTHWPGDASLACGDAKTIDEHSATIT